MTTFGHALIMAAGRGLRMMPLTAAIPKPMAPFDGTTLIASRIDTLKAHIGSVHITVGYKGAMLAKHVIEHNVSSVINTEGRGNAYWLYHTLLRHLDEPVVVLTCDNVATLDFAGIAAEYDGVGRPACMVVPVEPVEGLDGDFIFHDNQLVTEITRDRPSPIYCSGIQVLNPRRIGELTKPTESFMSVWQQLIECGQLACASVYPSSWMAIDTIDQLVRFDPASNS